MESEQTQPNRFYDFLAWAEVNKKQLIAGFAGFVVLVLLVAIYQWRQKEREANASRALSDVRLPATNSPAFLNVFNKYKGTKAGERALIMGAANLFAEGKYAEAQAQFERFLTEFKDSQWTGEARFGVATSLEAGNRLDEALAKYQELATTYSGDPLGEQARIAIGRVHEARQKPAEAFKIYDELVNSKTPGMWTLLARERREKLLRDHPALAPAPTNAAPAVATNSMSTLLRTNAPAPPTNRPAPPAPPK
jgi:predicted negative regulator of RcsB-dependent stress response